MWEAKLDQINHHLEALLPQEEDILIEAARYALLGPGKRMRPLITLLVAEALECPLQSALTPACALEMIHAYSMVHDDLPCMDDDDFRRGRPTLHKVYPEAIALLAGDFLLTYAFEKLATAPHLTVEKRLQLSQTLAARAGGRGMIGGQVKDLQSETKTISLQELQEIHLRKTADLLTAAFEFGGIVSGAPQATQSSLYSIGQDLGLAFQVIDDVLDITSSQAKHGKSTSSDEAHHKSTYPSHLGLEGAKKKASTLLKAAKEKITALFPSHTPLLTLADALVNRHQ
jgi:geranylgeranyl pyrophosphate synthase